jgi:hypothetical protein
MIDYEKIQDCIRVLDHIAKGNVPTRACDDMDVSYMTFCRLTATYSQLRAMRDEAEDRCYDVLADRLLTIHEDIQDPKMANVALEVNITADREVLEALQQAKARAQGQAMVAKAAEDVLDLTVLHGVASVLPHATESDEERYARELAEIS